jgi:hypothetical protein
VVEGIYTTGIQPTFSISWSEDEFFFRVEGSPRYKNDRLYEFDSLRDLARHLLNRYESLQPTLQPKLILIANSVDYSLAEDCILFLRNRSFEVVHVSVFDSDSYKNKGLVVILGGPDSGEGVGEIVTRVLSKDEQNGIRESESAIYNKSDVWRHGQVVFVLAKLVHSIKNILFLIHRRGQTHSNSFRLFNKRDNEFFKDRFQGKNIFYSDYIL